MELSSWTWNNISIEDISQFPSNTHGFIYVIFNEEVGMCYLGKKQLHTVRNVKLGKKELQAIKEERKENNTRGRLPSKKEVIKEYDWKTYTGSSDDLNGWISNNPDKLDKIHRYIMFSVPTKKLLTYYEGKYLRMCGVIEPESGHLWYNKAVSKEYSAKDWKMPLKHKNKMIEDINKSKGLIEALVK